MAVFIPGILGEETADPPVFGGQDGSPPSIGYPIPVRSNGTISLPLIKPIMVQGKPIEEIEELVKEAYIAGNFLTRVSMQISLLKFREGSRSQPSGLQPLNPSNGITAGLTGVPSDSSTPLTEVVRLLMHVNGKAPGAYTGKQIEILASRLERQIQRAEIDLELAAMKVTQAGIDLDEAAIAVKRGDTPQAELRRCELSLHGTKAECSQVKIDLKELHIALDSLNELRDESATR